MEDALVPAIDYHIMIIVAVLILVLMEDALVRFVMMRMLHLQ